MTLFFDYLVVPSKPPAISSTPSHNKPVTTKATQQKVQILFDDQTFQDLDLSSMRRTIAKRLTQSKVYAFTPYTCQMKI